MNQCKEYLSELIGEKLLSKNSFSLDGTTPNFNKVLLASDFYMNKKTIFVCLPNLYQAQNYYDDLTNIMDPEDVLFYPSDELVTSEMIVSSIEFKLERILTIQSLLEEKPYIVVMATNGLLKYQLSKDKWKKSILKYKKGDVVDTNHLVTTLGNLGYKRNYTVSRVGEFSIRGSIIDVFPMNCLNPIRLDFFGDELDRIKTFDLNKQTSIEEISNVIITPMNELFFDDTEQAILINSIKEFMNDRSLSTKEIDMFVQNITSIETRKDLDLLGRFTRFLSEETILDFKDDKRIYFFDLNSINRNYEKMVSDVFEYGNGLGGSSLCELAYFKELPKVLVKNEINFVNSYKDNINSKSIPILDTVSYGGNFELLITDLKTFKDKTVILALDKKEQLKEIEGILCKGALDFKVITEYKEIKGPGIYLINECFLSFNFVDEKLIFLSSTSIFKKESMSKELHYKSVYGETKRLKSIDELKVGDYVVHFDYGIGKYIGLKTVSLSGLDRDYLQIEYAKGDSIYVPLEKLDLIAKYGGSEDYKPNLSTLGTNKWEQTKEKVKKRINDISEKLIKLYAEREASTGYAFDKDYPEQLSFEADFPYDLTLDQEKAIKAVKYDMEINRPMDRLICGDVGYGKTEVAMRAAFKAIMSGKQVAYLAPTTMLSRQHYHTFLDRFAKYGANIELLNRFVSAKKQKETLSKLKTGEVDIVIGTHRILSKDMVFRDLGLLIIDEEQRFGVEHKERIKEMKVNVDTITLTATPIPRTLQMAIMGIKDLSNLDTPPKNRYPVQTYVLERNEMIIKEAIERELARNGQVFYLYNRTDDIDVMAENINKMVPRARIAFAHGKMNKYQLEEIISDFIDHEYDVLVCTTIIETGIDIPNTNTIIINDADHLGLSQLYQIRGRVGRTNKIAYAYLMYDGRKVLTETSHKRLEAIKNFTELGSGFKIAMRDLSIRGAGDILGSDQSGFIDSVGIELYMKMLTDSIDENNGLKKDKGSEEELGTVLSNRHIPNSYISDDGLRIEMHRRIDKLKSSKELEELAIELKDRFGFLDKKIVFYMYEKLFKKLANKLGATRIENVKRTIIITIPEKKISKERANLIFIKSLDLKDNLRISWVKGDVTLTLLEDNLADPWVKIFARYLEEVLV